MRILNDQYGRTWIDAGLGWAGLGTVKETVNDCVTDCSKAFECVKDTSWLPWGSIVTDDVCLSVCYKICTKKARRGQSVIL